MFKKKAAKDRPRSKKSLRRKLLIGSGLSVLVIALATGLFTNISAQAADNILRPLLGEKRTLALESVYFGIEDKLNHLHYLIFGQSAPVYSTPDTTSLTAKPVSNNLNKTPTVKGIDLTPIAADQGLPYLAGEGNWVGIAQNLFPQDTVVARTFIRPDATHPYAVVSLVKMDMTKLGLGVQAGTYYPGGTRGVFGPGVVPQQIRASNALVAAFNGGFQEKDGHYGMIVDNKTYVPLRLGLPALLLDQSGQAKFIDYTGQPIPPGTKAVRQNGPYLVHNGVIASFGGQGTDVWGRTITNSMYTWRSGLGITKDGNLVYAVGNSLVPQTLAVALQKAGAVDAIQLDINPPWVRYIVYESLGGGRYTSTPLLSDMVGGEAYLTKYNKDFFYLFKK